MYLKTMSFCVICGLLCVLTACDDDKTQQPTSNNTPQKDMSQQVDMSKTDMTPKPKRVLASNTPRVKFKGGERWAKDVQRALSLSDAQTCRELSQYDCVKQVHRITLGGVEPYRLGIDKPVDKAPITAPIAVDRIALYSCFIRAYLDIKAPDKPVVFTTLKDGAKPSKEDLGKAAQTLYDRLLQRDASADEQAVLVDFYTEVESDSKEPLVDWAMLSCFMVASSTEALFY